MQRSLTALLPVRNAESALEGLVHEILDVLPELTRQFELLLVDDCSSDATIEVADELLGQYPQLRVIRQPAPRGRAEAIRTGLERGRGDFFFLADEECGLGLNEAAKAWEALAEHSVVLARRAYSVASPDSWLPPLPTKPGGYLFGRHETLLPLASSLVDQTGLSRILTRLGLSYCELEVAGRKPAVALRRAALRARRMLSVRRDVEHSAPQIAPVSRPKQPNFLHASQRSFS